MAAFTVTIDDGIALVQTDPDEDRVSTATLDAWDRALDRIEDAPDCSAMVVTGSGHVWCSGLDLDAYETLGDAAARAFMRRVDLLLGRILTAPFVTIAALNGHTYAAGALLALAHDYRVMRTDRGWFCLPSVDVGIPFTPGMSALIAGKLPQPIAHDLVVSARRIDAAEALAAGVVTAVAERDDVVGVSLALASGIGRKDPATLATVKRRMYPEATDMLTPSR